ncbi:MAG: DNA-directed RNA polymerase subunit P [archaeon]|nr:DNA-directed RNA polymerase subunit P [archaeon]
MKCKQEVPMILTGAIRCPSCGNKVFSKQRDPVSKTIKAI